MQRSNDLSFPVVVAALYGVFERTHFELNPQPRYVLEIGNRNGSHRKPTVRLAANKSFRNKLQKRFTQRSDACRIATPQVIKLQPLVGF